VTELVVFVAFLTQREQCEAAARPQRRAGQDA
jgi:hypothetical protein